MGFLGMSPVSGLQETGFLQPPRPSLSSKGQAQIREGRGGRDKEGAGEKPSGQALVPLNGYSAVSWSSLAERKLPPEGDVNCVLPTSRETPARKEPEGW